VYKPALVRTLVSRMHGRPTYVGLALPYKLLGPIYRPIHVFNIHTCVGLHFDSDHMDPHRYIKNRQTDINCHKYCRLFIIKVYDSQALLKMLYYDDINNAATKFTKSVNNRNVTRSVQCARLIVCLKKTYVRVFYDSFFRVGFVTKR